MKPVPARSDLANAKTIPDHVVGAPLKLRMRLDATGKPVRSPTTWSGPR